MVKRGGERERGRGGGGCVRADGVETRKHWRQNLENAVDGKLDGGVQAEQVRQVQAVLANLTGKRLGP
jgi:hypothetical protein